MSATKERGITVTIKYGKGFEETWAVFNGQNEEVREDLISYFGVDRASVAELTLSELVTNCTQIAHGKGNAAAMLGGTVISNKKAGKPAESASAASGEDVWADDTPEGSDGAQSGAEEAGEDGAKKVVLDAIAQAPDVKKLQRVWAENQPLFTDPDVMAAYKARGKALKEAA